ncbi:hypothetical protein RintRC_5291 [Richelia intracellularis]|nr:hypothetical protein RintRC_5291 [Richelia intracellularis]
MPNTSNMTINYLKAGLPIATGLIEGGCLSPPDKRQDGYHWG